jgi:hypothetical protein
LERSHSSCSNSLFCRMILSEKSATFRDRALGEDRRLMGGNARPGAAGYSESDALADRAVSPAA